MKVVVLYRAHTISESILNSFAALRDQLAPLHDTHQAVFLVNASELQTTAPREAETFCVEDFKNLGFRLVPDEQRTLVGLPGPMMWFHNEYPILQYYLQNRLCDFIWSIDYDVGFSGNWRTFFEYFLPDNSDLLAAHHEEQKNSPTWNFRDNYCDISIPKERYLKVFFSVTRFSACACETLIRRYRSGSTGFCEIAVPTLLADEGLKITDLAKASDFASIEYFRWRPYWQIGETPSKINTLYHPVRVS